jgi:serine phosphatase RsbU (regulator of sigma subunit)
VGFASGDVLVLYSDGVTEYPFRQELYGEERLAVVAQRLTRSGAAAQAIVDGILGDVRSFARGGPADDDVTLVVVVHRPHGPEGG